MTKKPKVITQKHHLQYPSEGHPSQKEEVAYITKGEHGVLTRMQWWCKNTVSKGFIKALKVWLALNEDRAIDLEEYYEGSKTK